MDQKERAEFLKRIKNEHIKLMQSPLFYQSILGAALLINIVAFALPARFYYLPTYLYRGCWIALAVMAFMAIRQKTMTWLGAVTSALWAAVCLAATNWLVSEIITALVMRWHGYNLRRVLRRKDAGK